MEQSTHDLETGHRSERGFGYANIASLADAITTERPTNNPSWEQFLMQPGSLAAQAEHLSTVFAGLRVLFLGDDDHVSVIAAAFSDIQAVVVELDGRVVNSLIKWRDRLGISNLIVHQADVRNPPALERECDAFYVNPPYSSKNAAHGLKVWISVATDMCTAYCDGIVVMPSSAELDWVNQNWLTIQAYVTMNGYRIVGVGTERQAYIDTNDLGLRSQNLMLHRVRPGDRVVEHPGLGASLYR